MKMFIFVANMRKFILFVSMLCVAVGLKAQQPIAYTYDAAGNRTSSAIYFNRGEMEDEAESDDENDSDNLLDVGIHVTAAPNPTRGYLQVYVQELTGGEGTCTLSLFDVSGRRVLKQQTSSPLTTLDLTAQGEGLYLLRADLGEDSATLKILKESE